MQWRFKLAVGLLFFFGPLAASAASASILGLYPQDGVAGIGTRVAFIVVPSGFTSPSYYLTDSFPGGATTINIDSSGNFVWVPNKDDVGEHTFTVQVSDAAGNAVSVSTKVTVILPSVTLSDVPTVTTIRYGTPISFSISSKGFQAPTYSVQDSAPHSSVWPFNLQNLQFNWTPLLQDVGVHTLTFSAADLAGRSASASVSFTILDTQQIALTATPPGGTIGVGQKLTISAVALGGGGTGILAVQDLFYTPATTTFSFESGVLTWTPVYNDVGVHTFHFSATDALGKTTSNEIKITVVPYSVSEGSNTAPSSTIGGTVSATAPSSYVFTTFLTLGSQGKAVTELQKKLSLLGYLKTTPTGYFGALTKKAVQDFQKAKGLEAVGFVGPGTRAALNK